MNADNPAYEKEIEKLDVHSFIKEDLIQDAEWGCIFLP